MKKQKPEDVGKLAHTMVAKLAVEMANCVWEKSMGEDNEAYRTVKASHPGKSTEFLRKQFVAYLAPRMVADARATLAKMLNSPSVSEEEKVQIYDALQKDAAFRAGRGQGNFRLMN